MMAEDIEEIELKRLRENALKSRHRHSYPVRGSTRQAPVNDSSLGYHRGTHPHSSNHRAHTSSSHVDTKESRSQQNPNPSQSSNSSSCYSTSPSSSSSSYSSYSQERSRSASSHSSRSVSAQSRSSYSSSSPNRRYSHSPRYRSRSPHTPSPPRRARRPRVPVGDRYSSGHLPLSAERGRPRSPYQGHQRGGHPQFSPPRRRHSPYFPRDREPDNLNHHQNSFSHRDHSMRVQHRPQVWRHDSSPRRSPPRRPSPRRMSPRRPSPRRPSPRRPSPRRSSPRRPSPRRPLPPPPPPRSDERLMMGSHDSRRDYDRREPPLDHRDSRYVGDRRPRTPPPYEDRRMFNVDRREISPGRMRERRDVSPGHRRDISPGRRRGVSPGRMRERRDISGRMLDRRDVSPVRMMERRDMSPGRRRDMSPGRMRRGVSPGRIRERRIMSPGRRRDISPGRRRDVSPGRMRERRDISPGRRRDVSPGRIRERRDMSPGRRREKPNLLPGQMRDERAASPEQTSEANNLSSNRASSPLHDREIHVSPLKDISSEQAEEKTSPEQAPENSFLHEGTKEERKRKRIHQDDMAPTKFAKSGDLSLERVEKVRRPSGLTGLDALDEELDYDESMDDIERYLQEEEMAQAETTLKSEVRVKPSSPEKEPSPPINGEKEVIAEHVEEVKEENEDKVGGKEGEEEEEGQLVASDSDPENTTEVGVVREVSMAEVSPEEEEEEEAEEAPPPTDSPVASDGSSSGHQPVPVISSPIRITPEPAAHTGNRKISRSRQISKDRHAAAGKDIDASEQEGERNAQTPRLSVKERLYISKKDIERKKEATNYRQQHKISSNLESRLGPSPNNKRGHGPKGMRSRNNKRQPKGNAIEIAEAFRRQKKNEGRLQCDQQELKKGQRFAKLVNEHQTRLDTNDRLSRRPDEDLDKRISRIRSNDQKRLERDKEVRKDRQLHG